MFCVMFIGDARSLAFNNIAIVDSTFCKSPGDVGMYAISSPPIRRAALFVFSPPKTSPSAKANDRRDCQQE